MRTTILSMVAAIPCLLAALPGTAQPVPPVPRPNESTLSGPDWDRSDAAAVLPPITQPDSVSAPTLASSVATFVRGYRFTGNSVVPDADLQMLAAPFSGRVVNAMELETLRQLISARYVELGRWSRCGSSKAASVPCKAPVQNACRRVSWSSVSCRATSR